MGADPKILARGKGQENTSEKTDKEFNFEKGNLSTLDPCNLLQFLCQNWNNAKISKIPSHRWFALHVHEMLNNLKNMLITILTEKVYKNKLK